MIHVSIVGPVPDYAILPTATLEIQSVVFEIIEMKPASFGLPSSVVRSPTWLNRPFFELAVSIQVMASH